MRRPHRRAFAGFAAGVALAFSFATSAAEPYPGKPVRLIVPYGAGGPNDTLGRYFARELSERWGQPMVVENRPGAGANIGMAAVAKSPPDGYTLMIAGSFAITVNPSLYRSMPLDPAADLAPIIRFASAPLIMVVSPDSPANSVSDFIALAKGAPRLLNGCSLGPGTGPGVGLELFKQLSGIRTVDINYRAVPQCYASVISGETAVYFDGPLVLALVQSKKLKALAVSAPSRLALGPDVPTMKEAGLPEHDLLIWYAFYGPKGMPDALRARLRKDVASLLTRAEVRAQLEKFGYAPEEVGPEELARIIAEETQRWARLVRAANWSIE